MARSKVYRILLKPLWFTSAFSYTPTYLYYDMDVDAFEVGSRSVARKHKFEFTKEEVEQMKKDYDMSFFDICKENKQVANCVKVHRRKPMKEMLFMSDVAPQGQVWVCSACGKTSKNRQEIGDVSCYINAVLCYIDSLRIVNGRVVEAETVLFGRKNEE